MVVTKKKAMRKSLKLRSKANKSKSIDYIITYKKQKNVVVNWTKFEYFSKNEPNMQIRSL